MADFTADEISALKGSILGTELDSAAAYFKSTGAMGSRTALNTEERMITRAINVVNDSNILVQSAVNAFTATFERIVGDIVGANKKDFDSLDGNLIETVAKMKEEIRRLTEDEGAVGFAGPVAYSRTIMGDGVTSDFSIRHDLDSMDVKVSITNGITGADVWADISIDSPDSITISFAVLPAVGQSYRVIIHG